MKIQFNTSHHFHLIKIPLIAVLLALLLMSLVNTRANAQDRTLRLQEAIELGLQNSKVLKLSQSKIDEAVSQYNQEKDRALPEGSVSLAYNRAQIPYNRLSLGEQSISLPKSANAFLGIASVNQTIFAGHRLKYAQESTNMLTDIARLDAVKDKDQITYDIINAYYNLYKVQQSIKVVNQNLETIDDQIHQSQRFFEQGLVTKNDVLRFQLQRSNIQMNGVDLESNRKIINHNLNILLGLPESTRLVIDEIPMAKRAIGTLNDYVDSALTNRKELAQLDIRKQIAETNIKSIKANTTPTLAASVGAYYVDVSANPIPRSGNFITPVTVGLTASWNFGTLWTNKNKIAQAKIQETEVDINKGIVSDQLRNEVNQNYQNYITAMDKIQLLQTAIEQAGENNNILASKYKSNIASATDRADAETLLYQAQINLALAKADADLAYYTLIKSTGKLNK
ncbi:TolC family protein [Mucilaginibacter auburnensis]|uniref:Outer membrane protein TolC n=1 Tax=Mucilaginibacter auburnensis TaxID=1457233 RepID=A0A2H9VTH5_9SPHI|nr:TolC family protein [Mucilaginibacter auburnensis]PJJ84092.1 outer membrane protein TolC [Mucilaginibacter auburnensis]